MLGKEFSMGLGTRPYSSSVPWVCLHPAWVAKGQDCAPVGPSKNLAPLLQV